MPQELSEGFYAMLVASGFAFLAALLGVCYKSKCVRISCCGLVIDRDVAGEEKLDETALSQLDRPSNLGLSRGNDPDTTIV